MKEKHNSIVKGFQYLFLGLYAFAGLGIEIIYGLLLEPRIYGKELADWTTTQSIIHWVITCITWGLIAYFIIRLSKNKYGFDLFENNGKMRPWQWIGVVLCILFSLGMSYWDWNGFKVVKEYQYNGLLKFIFQYIYYVFETVLFTLILVYGQKAFEIWFKKDNMPYGGIIVAITWGMAHVFTKGSVLAGVLTAIGGFTYGIVYLLVNRDIKKTLPIIFIMFVF